MANTFSIHHAHYDHIDPAGEVFDSLEAARACRIHEYPDAGLYITEEDEQGYHVATHEFAA